MLYLVLYNKILEMASNTKRCQNISASWIELMTDHEVEKILKSVFKTTFYRHELHGKRSLGGNRWTSKKKSGRVSCLFSESKRNWHQLEKNKGRLGQGHCYQVP